MDCLQPDMQGDVTRFENGPDLNGKWLPAGVALIDADPSALAFQRSRAIDNAAFRAYTPVRPNLRLDVGISGALVAETGLIKNGLRHQLSPCQRIYNAY